MPEPTPAEMQKIEADQLTPLQRVQSHAREAVFTIEPALKSVGLDDLKIQALVEANAKRATQEYQEMEKQDPLLRIEEALRRSAVTDTDKQLAEAFTYELEQKRTDWKRVFNEKRTILRMQGQENTFSAEKTVKDAVESRRTPSLVDYEFRTGKSTIFLDVLDKEVLDPNAGGWVKPSKEFQENIFHSLGILHEGEQIQDLWHLPAADLTKINNRKPRIHIDVGRAENLSTNIPDVTATTFLHDGRLMAGITPTTLEKIVAFPALV